MGSSPLSFLALVFPAMGTESPGWLFLLLAFPCALTSGLGMNVETFD